MATATSPHDMHTRLAGGGEIPLVGLGTWRLNGDAAREAVGWALDAGYRHIDTATAYGNEQDVGRAIHGSGIARDGVFVTTKMPAENVGRERATLEQSLSAMAIDHVDLWLVHWPPGRTAGVTSWREFVRAREDGLTRAIGVSNYSLDQIDELTEATGVTPEINQVRWSPSLFDPRDPTRVSAQGVSRVTQSVLGAVVPEDPGSCSGYPPTRTRRRQPRWSSAGTCSTRSS